MWFLANDQNIYFKTPLDQRVEWQMNNNLSGSVKLIIDTGNSTGNTVSAVNVEIWIKDYLAPEFIQAVYIIEAWILAILLLFIYLTKWKKKS